MKYTLPPSYYSDILLNPSIKIALAKRIYIENTNKLTPNNGFRSFIHNLRFGRNIRKLLRWFVVHCESIALFTLTFEHRIEEKKKKQTKNKCMFAWKPSGLHFCCIANRFLIDSLHYACTHMNLPRMHCFNWTETQIAYWLRRIFLFKMNSVAVCWWWWEDWPWFVFSFALLFSDWIFREPKKKTRKNNEHIENKNWFERFVSLFLLFHSTCCSRTSDNQIGWNSSTYKQLLSFVHFARYFPVLCMLNSICDTENRKLFLSESHSQCSYELKLLFHWVFFSFGIAKVFQTYFFFPQFCF